MKTAIYTEDGIAQLVITPETDFEKESLRLLMDRPLDAKVFTGSFYDCRGGWVRQNAHKQEGDFIDKSLDCQDRSLIIRVDDPK